MANGGIKGLEDPAPGTADRPQAVQQSPTAVFRDMYRRTARQGDGGLTKASPASSPPSPLPEAPPSPQFATLWAQADTLFLALKGLSDQCRHTAHDLERNLQEIERILGEIQKRP